MIIPTTKLVVFYLSAVLAFACLVMVDAAPNSYLFGSFHIPIDPVAPYHRRQAFQERIPRLLDALTYGYYRP
ncbi:unnamed protein product [Darwinula stevensoni]|uniref:Uncharacterized protein n=1 Tax=Darwinula stevensoni TaxID=69355 RepID=A0A7R8XF66_9CRUS|nr:unnamed protein product [Darwinula stevensoni]CAG0894977.1 unnamed protein product [Darwinula stevensoni]